MREKMHKNNHSIICFLQRSEDSQKNYDQSQIADQKTLKKLSKIHNMSKTMPSLYKRELSRKLKANFNVLSKAQAAL